MLNTVVAEMALVGCYAFSFAFPAQGLAKQCILTLLRILIMGSELTGIQRMHLLVSLC